LFSHHPGSFHFFRMLQRIRDNPMPAAKLNCLGALIGQANGVLENPQTLKRLRIFSRVSRQNLDADVIGDGFRNRGESRWGFRHVNAHDTKLVSLIRALYNERDALATDAPEQFVACDGHRFGAVDSSTDGWHSPHSGWEAESDSARAERRYFRTLGSC